MKESIINYVDMWEKRCYSKGIPDEAPRELEVRNKVPSYRRICYCILRNDYALKSLGYTPKKSDYYNVYKKIEIDNRNNCKQLKLDL